MNWKIFIAFCSLCAVPLTSCDNDKMMDEDLGLLTNIVYNPTPHQLQFPKNFGQPIIPIDNLMTDEGIALGKALFYDPILSKDSSISCATCHRQSASFSDPKKFSLGVNNTAGVRNAMAITNLAFIKNDLFWDGNTPTLESQALLPIEDPVEMHHTWPDVVTKLKKHTTYPSLFRKAFGIRNKNEITKDLAVKAISQFERTMISSNSKFDRVLRGEELFTDLELYGYEMFIDENPDIKDAECGHCHSLPLGTADRFFNNGLDLAPTLMEFKDKGRGSVTGNLLDNGKFKAPTLRNIALSAPYMHDGRFQTLDEVLDHYSSGGKMAPNKDPLIYSTNFTSLERRALKAFINTLTDSTFITNPKFRP
jgi:cytochrome c peroxidase